MFLCGGGVVYVHMLTVHIRHVYVDICMRMTVCQCVYVSVTFVFMYVVVMCL